MIDTAYRLLFQLTLIAVAAIIITALIRTITGRLTVDKIIGLNMIGTLTVISMLVLTALLGEDYIADIAIIYVMLSFIAVLILSKIYINLFTVRRIGQKSGKSGKGGDKNA